jgi:hypothetical protein
MADGNTFSKAIDKHCVTVKADDVYVNAITCQTCGSAVIIEFDAKLDHIALYDFEPCYANSLKIFHVHSADERIRNLAREMLAAEKRLLHDADRDDYHYSRR